jgi:hypothetical protein
MSGLPFRSKLAPFEQEITELRRKRPPVSYRQIVQLLKERHGVEVTINGVFVFLRTRRKWYRREAADAKKQTAPQKVSQVSRSQRPALPAALTNRPGGSNQGTPGRKLFNYTYSNTYNLTRLTPEEKAALEKKMEKLKKVKKVKKAKK